MVVHAPEPAYVDYHDAPAHLFGHNHWDGGGEIIRAIFQPHSRVAVKGCHSSGKTFAAADAVLMALYEGADVITTAPTDDQVRGVMWAQIHDALRDANVDGWGEIMQKGIHGLDGVYALGRATNQGVRFQGYHSREGSYLLIVIDEAPGLEADMFNAIEGIASGGDVRILMLGNPTLPSGPFFDVFENESLIWRRYTIDAFDTPNLAGVSLERLLEMSDAELDDNARPYLVTRRWVRDRFDNWGVDHPEWQARVRGEFPQNADISLIWRSWIEDAKAKEAQYADDGGPLVAGIDVAGPGEDETVCYVRQGAGLLDAAVTKQQDPLGVVLDLLRPHVQRGLTTVNFDEVGIGFNFGPRLQEVLGDSVNVVGVNVANKPSSTQAAEQFVNLKAELYWGLRERFKDGSIAGITDPLLISQLAGLRYEHKNGKVLIESKQDAAKRGVKSPDRAEALMLCFAPQLRGQRLAGAFQAAAKRREW